MAAAVAFGLTVAPVGPAMSCFVDGGWPTGDDVAKLEPGEFAVQARLLESYKIDERSNSAANHNLDGMIYFVQIEEVVGGPGAADSRIKGMFAKRILVRSSFVGCGSYVPANFHFGDRKLLVLKKVEDELFELVGGK